MAGFRRIVPGVHDSEGRMRSRSRRERHQLPRVSGIFGSCRSDLAASRGHERHTREAVQSARRTRGISEVDREIGAAGSAVASSDRCAEPRRRAGGPACAGSVVVCVAGLATLAGVAVTVTVTVAVGLADGVADPQAASKPAAAQHAATAITRRAAAAGTSFMACSSGGAQGWGLPALDQASRVPAH